MNSDNNKLQGTRMKCAFIDEMNVRPIIGVDFTNIDSTIEAEVYEYVASNYYYKIMNKFRYYKAGYKRVQNYQLNEFINLFKSELKVNDDLKIFILEKFKGCSVSIDKLKYSWKRSAADNNKQVYIKIELSKTEYTCLYISTLLDLFPTIVNKKH